MPFVAPEVLLAEKVAALRDPACYPDGVRTVDAIETHMSWVFLTEEHAWKLKKPVRYDHQDFRTAAARHFYCLEELRLNRRLAPSVYLDVLPLTREPGGLRAGGRGRAVDWLVKMRRLPGDQLLDALLARHAAVPQQMHAVAARLAAFHRALPPAPLAARGYRALLARHIEDHAHELCNPAWSLPLPRLRRIGERLRAFVHDHAAELDARVAAGRVVEGHGDLRPEHVWLGEPMAIIDALEFSVELRLQDAADEVGFLALECERAHEAPLAQALLDAWRACSGDDVSPALLHFYQAGKGWGRARLAIGHLHEARYRDSPHWRRRALRYLALAERHLRAAELSPAAAP